MARIEQQAPARDRLLSAATRLFIENGFAGTPVSRIVRKAGVTMPVLYYHFGSKADLLRAVISARGQWMRTDLQPDPALDFAGNCAGMVDHALEHIVEIRDGLRLRLLLGFETGPEVETLRGLVQDQRAKSLARIAAVFSTILPDASVRRISWLGETYLSGVQALALELTGMTRQGAHLAAKGRQLVRGLADIASMPEDELPELAD